MGYSAGAGCFLEGEPVASGALILVVTLVILGIRQDIYSVGVGSLLLGLGLAAAFWAFTLPFLLVGFWSNRLGSKPSLEILETPKEVM
ncbi:MAG: hypothetical protein M0Z31_06580 [Clostridia bacterium]|nr:hypothetical protein [Clostridia bacterium]